MKRILTPAEHAAAMTAQNNAAPVAASVWLAPVRSKVIYMVALTCHDGECMKPLGWFWTYTAAEKACPALLLEHDATQLHIAELAMGEP